MKYLFPITFLLFSLSSYLFGQTLEEIETKIAAKNHIRTKIQIDYKYSKGKPSNTGVKSVTKSYSSKGELLEKRALSSKGEVIGWEKYTYDEAGNRTLYERENTSSNYKKASKYDDKNNVLLEAGFNGAENFRNEYKYTPSGKVMEIIYYVGNRMEQKMLYEYSGNIAIVGIYAGGNTLTSKMNLKYDGKENITEEIKQTIDGVELEKKIYTYNTAGEILQEEKIIQGNFNYRLTYAYDTSGNLLKISEENNNESKYDKKVYTYDSAGNLTEYKWRRSPSDEFNIKKFTYNSQGICLTEYTFYPKTRYELLSKFEYEYY
jgi:YD repeat-containing protein